MSKISRRRFLKTAAATAAGARVLGTIAATARAVSGTDYAIQGIDISHWQGSINWTSVKNSGKTFAFMKATEGTTYTDPHSPPTGRMRRRPASSAGRTTSPTPTPAR